MSTQRWSDTKMNQSSPLTYSAVQDGSIVPGEYRFESHAVPRAYSQILPSLLSNTLSDRHCWNSTWLSDNYVTICSNTHLNGIIQDILRYLRGKSSFVENTNVIASTSYYNRALWIQIPSSSIPKTHLEKGITSASNFYIFKFIPINYS